MFVLHCTDQSMQLLTSRAYLAQSEVKLDCTFWHHKKGFRSTDISAAHIGGLFSYRYLHYNSDGFFITSVGVPSH